MDAEGFGVPPRKLTLSTVGILPALEKLAQEPVRPNLAISLHAPDPGLRRALMPIEEKYPFERRGRRRRCATRSRAAAASPSSTCCSAASTTRAAHARELARRLGGRRVQGEPDPAQPRARDPVQGAAARGGGRLLRRVLAAAGVTVSVRRPRGQRHPGRLRPAPPQEGRRRRRPPHALTRTALSRRSLRRRARALVRRAARAAAAEPRRGAARARRDLLPGRGARHGRERRLAGPVLPGPAVLRQADADLLADGRRHAGARARPPRRRAWCRCWRRSASCSRRAWLGRSLFDRRAALCGAPGARHHPRLPVLRARRDVRHAARALVTTLAVALAVLAYLPGRAAGWPCRCSASSLGLGFATKGPIALLVPGLGDPAAARARNRQPAAALRAGGARARRSRSPCWASAGSCSSTAGSGASPLVYFFLRENLERFAGETYDVGRPALVLPAGLPRRGPALVAVPAARARAARPLGRRRDERRRRALPRRRGSRWCSCR